MTTAVRTHAPATSVRLPSLRDFAPNWYASVMGTAVVATAGTALDVPGTEPALVAVWALSAVLLMAVLAARVAHWAHHRDRARAHLLDPAVAPFYGCLSMALLAVGISTLNTGRGLIGTQTATTAAFALFAVGTAAGLAVAVAVPYLLVVRHRTPPGTASPVWLLPVVPPMVAASFGPLLVPYLPGGQARTAMLAASGAMAGMSLLATLVILPLVFGRLVHHGPLPLALTPALFLVLGPLGQSVTAVTNMARATPRGEVLAVAYGVPVMGFALLWLALAGAMVVRAFRAGMPFTMSWWAFTFPVGTCVTGAAGLAEATDLRALAWLAAGLYALLVTAWAVTGALTLRGLFSGALLAAPRR
ncbi:TDT family transporter [Streptomyces sp. NPDC055078]